MPSKVIIIVIELMFLGINIFWALLRAHFNPCLMARAKRSLSWPQNIFMPANMNSIVLLFCLLNKHLTTNSCFKKRTHCCSFMSLNRVGDKSAAEISQLSW